MKKPDTSGRLRGLSVRSRWGVFLLACCFCLTLPIAYTNLNHNLYLERSTNVETTMSQVARNVDTSVQYHWGMVDHFVEILSADEPQTLEEAFQLLRKMNATSDPSITRFFLIDDGSYCYQPEGQRYRWSNQPMLGSGKQECLISTAEFLVEEEGSYMIFVSPLKESMTLDGRKFTHFGMAVTLDFLESFFNVELMGEDTVSFIVRKTGGQVYKQHKENPISEVPNLLSALERADFLWDESHAALVEDIQAGESGCVVITYEGESYYLAYAPLSANDWIAIMLLPEADVAVQAESFLFSVAGTLTGIAALALLLIVTIVVSVNRATNRQLKQAAEAEREANLAKTRFLSSMSHDIRTPMNAIIGMTRLAREHKDDADYVDGSLKKVEMASNHLLTLINDVLDISKVESGRMTLNPSKFSLENELATLVNIFAPQAEAKKQTFACHAEGLEGKTVFADKLRLNQIMLNLVSNAVKYTPDGGEVTLTARGEAAEDGGDALRFTFCVQDTGVGMSEKFQQEMYSSFTREATEGQKEIQGSGLGLAICKQMVELLGGSIACDSAVGRGTTFTVTLTLPLAEEPAAVADPATGKPSLSMEELQGVRILIAEDNEFNWEIAREVLGLYGVLTERAENGAECVRRAEEAEAGYFRMILMDIQMPVMNGYEATKAIRQSARPHLRQIPIIAMTADAFAEDVQHARDVGMNDHVSKPIDMERLLEVVAHYCA